MVPSTSRRSKSPADVETVPLCELRPGERARLHATDLACEDCELLRAMGMTEQCRLKVCRGGGTCIVQVNATRLGLSSAIARRIMVAVEKPVPVPAPAVARA